MKKIFNCISIVFFLVLSSGLAHSQTLKSITVRNFISSLKKLHMRFLSASGHAGLLLTTPSTANLVKFPHFSLGSSGGIAVDARRLGKIIENPRMSFASVKSNDLFDHIPAFGWGVMPTLRFGGGGIPFDVGFYGMYIPMKLDNEINFSKLSIGADFRYALLKDESRKPGVSVGIKYMYALTGMEWYSDDLSFKAKDSRNKEISIFIESNKFKFNFSDHVISVPFQLSKLLASFFEPYVGVEPFIAIGSLSLNSDISPKVKYDGKLLSIQKYVRQVAKLKTDTILLSEKGLRYNQTVVNGGIRLYGGFALKLWLFYLDTQISYEPIHSELGGSVGLRFQY